MVCPLEVELAKEAFLMTQLNADFVNPMPQASWHIRKCETLCSHQQKLSGTLIESLR